MTFTVITSSNEVVRWTETMLSKVDYFPDKHSIEIKCVNKRKWKEEPIQAFWRENYQPTCKQWRYKYGRHVEVSIIYFTSNAVFPCKQYLSNLMKYTKANRYDMRLVYLEVTLCNCLQSSTYSSISLLHRMGEEITWKWKWKYCRRGLMTNIKELSFP